MAGQAKGGWGETHTHRERERERERERNKKGGQFLYFDNENE
jgi:hypothetical protein